MFFFTNILEAGIFDEQEEFIQWCGDPARVNMQMNVVHCLLLRINFTLSLSLSLSTKENFFDILNMNLCIFRKIQTS